MNQKIFFQTNESSSIKESSFKVSGRNSRDSSFLKKVVRNFHHKSWQNSSDYTGSWWFCIIDESINKIWLKRDKHDYTSVFFRLLDDTFFVSEDLDYLLNLHKVKLNLRKIASIMVSFEYGNGIETFFDGIYSLPAGSELIIENGHSKVSRYWFPENVSQLSWRKSEDYRETLRDIIDFSINQKIGSHCKVGSTLSGGLDSSSATCLTAEYLLKKGQELITFTHVPQYKTNFRNFRSSFGDESEYAKLVINKYPNISGNFLSSTQITPIDSLRKWVKLTNGIVHGASNVFWMYDLFKTVKDSDIELLITGENGNGTISFTGIRSKLPWSHQFYRQNILKGIKDKIYSPSKIRLKRLLGYAEKGSWNIKENFLNKNVLQELDLKEAYFIERDSYGTILDTPKSLMNSIIEQSRSGRMPLGGLISRQFGFEMADPTGSPELIEFCYSLPNEAFFSREGLSRNLIREMMDGVLPDKIRLETKKGLQSADIAARLQNTSLEVEEALRSISKNKLFEYLFDINSLNDFWKTLKYEDSKLVDKVMVNAFLKTIMAGFLIEKFS